MFPPKRDGIEILGKTLICQADSHHYLNIDDERCLDACSTAHLSGRRHCEACEFTARCGQIFRHACHEFRSDLAAVENGGRAIACSDEHYGSMQNLNVAGRGVNMGDGWETARRRGPGNDWVIFELGHAGAIDKVEVDTAHFKGNYPDRVSLEAAMFSNASDATPDSDAWQTLLPESRLEMDKQHYFESELNALGPVSHVRMSIYPDGGVSRVRLVGHIQLGDSI